MAPPTLTTLPPEVLRRVMAYFDDINDLLHIVQSSRATYSAFHASPHLLVAPLVEQSIPEVVLPQAIQTVKAHERRHNSLSPAPECPDAVAQVMGHNGGSESLGFKWNLARGLAALKLHQLIHRFASAVSRSYERRFMECNLGSGREYMLANPMSQSEILRIQRALYHFETYTYLFPPSHKGTPEKTKAAHASFFSKLYPWENEQLASIHEALWERAAAAYHDLAVHDSARGTHRVLYVDSLDDPITESILAKGLRVNLKIYQAKQIHGERHKALNWYTPAPGNGFLREPLKMHLSRISKPASTDVRFSRSAAASEAQKHLPSDPADKAEVDTDAMAWWDWLYERNDAVHLKWEDFKPMREMGYIFFNRQRPLNCRILPATPRHYNRMVEYTADPIWPRTFIQ